MKNLFAGMLLIALGGCSSADLPKDMPTTVTYSIVATQSVNPNVSGDATPIEVQVFELEDDSMFLSSGYDQLARSAGKALKSNYLDHRDYSMVPGQFKFIDEFTIDKDTRYIAVMARFSDPDASDWKKVVKILPIGRKYHLLVFLDNKEIVLDKVE
ncbi:type VI secretion system lipoprotein TssJ [Enterovibrio paralichthyis]|uniref:type VI secretion system lipoprotein TssJ n=1 Tax=Enterovibrio paralichthyis TaxID=2853805 RepID=UPI001C44DAA1|nr:type VI secretion system lipoprotein TssJ [Enterovibrio paralichthyis]MBV7298317.1 type VI secretion system lipoprotein TssJ [Enterovibrio paralichthyis]